MCVVSFLHLLQYMVAVPLIFGNLEPQMYNDDFAADPRIDELRAKTWCEEDPRYTTEYMEPEKRSIGNHVVVEFNDGSKIEYGLDYVSLARRGGHELAKQWEADTSFPTTKPVGHARRREEAIPLIQAKLKKHLDAHFDDNKKKQLLDLTMDHAALTKMPVHDFIDLWVKA